MLRAPCHHPLGDAQAEEALGDLALLDGPPGLLDPRLLDNFSERNALRLDGWDLARILAVACERLGVEEAALRAGRRTAAASRAREAVAWLANQRLGLPQATVARASGVSPQAVSRAFERAGAASDALRARFP